MSPRSTLLKTAFATAVALTAFVAHRYALPRIGLAEGPVVAVGSFTRLSAGTPVAEGGLIGASLALAAGEMTPVDGAALDRLRARGATPSAPASATSGRLMPRPSPAAADALHTLPGHDAPRATPNGETTPCLEGACPRPLPVASDPEATGSVSIDLAVNTTDDALPVRQARLFTTVDVLDGRSFRADGATVRLANVALPGPRQQCRRLDGVSEPCAERARTRLDLMTRHRPVACDLQPAATGTASAAPLAGDCRVGNTDLGLRLIREGWATPLTDTPEHAAALAEARRIKAGVWR